MKRRTVLFTVTLSILVMLPASAETAHRPIPVILDTDIGDDIDDTWALALALASPELDVKLVVSDARNAPEKAKILAKFLEKVGRTDIPVGVGLKKSEEAGPQAAWSQDYDLAGYPGRVHQDGVQATIDMIMNAPRPMTLIAIGPVPNLAEALRREPRIAERARLVVMGGSIEKQYKNKPGRCPEYNVREDARAAQIAYMAPWAVTMAPLDTAGVVRLKGDLYARVRDAANPLSRIVIENYRIWPGKKNQAAEGRSSILFDTVAVYLAFSEQHCRMQEVRLRVTDQGVTEPDPNGKLVRAAMDWTDRESFERILVERITNYRSARP